MMGSNLRAAIGLVVVLEVAPLTAKAETIECHARPESREYWSWRQIEGRQCWYKGHRRIDKKLLSWGPRKPAEGVDLDPGTFQMAGPPAALGSRSRLNRPTNLPSLLSVL